MTRRVLLTARRRGGFNAQGETAVLAGWLRSFGWDAVLADWRDPAIWDTVSGSDVVVHRYLGSLRGAHLGPVRAYLGRLAASFTGPVVNDPRLFEYGVRKEYLLHLQGLGHPVVPTLLLPATENVAAVRSAAAAADWGEAVVKPVDGELCQDVWRIRTVTPEQMQSAAARTDAFVVQPFLPGILAGQRSIFLVVSCGVPRVLYGMLKVPHGWRAKASLSVVREIMPSAEEAEVAAAAIRAWPGPVILDGFVRVDIVRDGGRSHILEVETVNPEGGLPLASIDSQRRYAEGFAEMLDAAFRLPRSAPSAQLPPPR